jgi:hypothetical protein
MKRIGGHHGVGQHFGGLLQESLADGQFAVVLGSAVGGHGQRGAGAVMAQGDDGSERALRGFPPIALRGS